VLSQAMYHARELAMTRMEAEADALRADGIVGVRLDVEMKEFGGRHRRGSSRSAPRSRPRRAPAAGAWTTGATTRSSRFTSDLSGQDFWTLIRAGYAPLAW